MEEVHAVINLVRYYYKTKDFCVITPYDAQRGAIQKSLKAADLPWDMVYNVDSFQGTSATNIAVEERAAYNESGHEMPYVIVSTVRTTRPGFLQSLQRMNVMLTRLQAGMVIVTNRPFLDSSGRNTLLGCMAQHWKDERGEAVWTLPQRIAERTANMPGVTMTPSTPKVPRAPSEAETASSSNSAYQRTQALSLSARTPVRNSVLASSPTTSSSARSRIPTAPVKNDRTSSVTSEFPALPTTRPRSNTNSAMVKTSYSAVARGYSSVAKTTQEQRTPKQLSKSRTAPSGGGWAEGWRKA